MKAVCLLSGGMDSATLAYMAKHDGYDILALHFTYGQRTERKEKECASGLPATSMPLNSLRWTWHT